MPRPTLRWATFLAPALEPLYRHIAGEASRAAGHDHEFTIGQRISDLVSGEVDVAFICGLPYVELMRSDPGSVVPLATPVISGRRYAGRPIYFSDVVVRADSPHRSFADLFDGVWTYNEPHSHSGYGLTRFYLARLDRPQGFRRVLQAGWHERAIDLVLDGTADASAIDSLVLEIERRKDPVRLERLRVIDSFGPSTVQPVIISARLPEGVRQDLLTAIIATDENPVGRSLMESLMIEKFVAVGDSDYDDIRRMLEVADRVGVSLGPESNAIPSNVPASVSLPRT